MTTDYLLKRFPWGEFPSARAHLEAERERLGRWLAGPHLHNLPEPTRERMEKLHKELSALLRKEDPTP